MHLQHYMQISYPPTYYTEAEKKDIEAMYMGTESEARKRYQGNQNLSQQQS